MEERSIAKEEEMGRERTKKQNRKELQSKKGEIGRKRTKKEN
jgi:hypothetical protein